ncbi:flavoprotein-like protein [Sporodiniella umbellata]|nr:flavoprotein-like protein [Sporodiniella umbellata]
MPTTYIIIYSVYHHIYTLAQSVQKGLEEQGVNVKLFQVAETLPEEVLIKLHAPAKPEIPIITVDALTEADAFIFGIPTRFGTLPAQMKAFLDSTGSLWATGGLAGKFAGTFFSSASQHGGQETTAYTLLTYFAHHGLNYVPLGFANAHLFDTSEVIGGSAYGAGTIANGDGSRLPSEKELAIAQTQGSQFATLLNTFHRGLAHLAAPSEANNAPIEAAIESAIAAPVATETTIEKREAKPSEPMETKPSEQTRDTPSEPMETKPSEQTETKPSEQTRDTPSDREHHESTMKSTKTSKKDGKKSKCFCM